MLIFPQCTPIRNGVKNNVQIEIVWHVNIFGTEKKVPEMVRKQAIQLCDATSGSWLRKGWYRLGEAITQQL